MSSTRSDDEIVVDAGPLIALARLRSLELLAQSFGNALTSRAVIDECLAAPSNPECEPIRSAIAAGYLQVFEHRFEHSIGQWNLDRGEASVIALAHERGSGVLLDDRAARRAARVAGLPVIGTCGLLLLAKRRQLIPAVSPLLNQLVESGYYLDAPLVHRVCRLAGEA